MTSASAQKHKYAFRTGRSQNNAQWGLSSMFIQGFYRVCVGNIIGHWLQCVNLIPSNSAAAPTAPSCHISPHPRLRGRV